MDPASGGPPQFISDVCCVRFHHRRYSSAKRYRRSIAKLEVSIVCAPVTRKKIGRIGWNFSLQGNVMSWAVFSRLDHHPFASFVTFSRLDHHPFASFVTLLVTENQFKQPSPGYNTNTLLLMQHKGADDNDAINCRYTSCLILAMQPHSQAIGNE